MEISRIALKKNIYTKLKTYKNKHIVLNLNSLFVIY